MNWFLKECPHCGGIIRNDLDYCHYCGSLTLSVPAPYRREGLGSWARRHKKRLIGVTVLVLAVGLVIVAKEPWYEPLAPRPDEVIMPVFALPDYVGLDVSSAQDRIRAGEIQVSVTRLSDGSVYQDVAGLPFSDLAFLVTFGFPIREARHDNTERLYKIFDGYVDEKWSRFWVAVYAKEVEWNSAQTSSDDVWGQEGYLPLEIEVLDTNRLLVLPEGIPEEGHIDWLINSPPPFLYVYYNKTTHTAYYYSGGYTVLTSPDFDEPEPITEER